MKTRISIITLFITTLITFSFFNVLVANPEGDALIRIQLSDIRDLPKLKKIPLSVNLRTDEYVLATIDTDNLSFLQESGYTYEILDTDGWSQPYYLISSPQNQPLTSSSLVGEVIYKSDHEAVIKTSEETLEKLRDAGFFAYKISAQALPLTVRLNSKLEDLQIEQLNDPIIAALVNRVSEANLRAALQRLQDFETRFSGSDSVYAASQWLYDQFKKYGYNDVVFDTLSYMVEGKIQRNVIAAKTGTKYPDRLVIIGGHYDSIVFDGTNPMVWAPGADDDGTGTVAVLETARILADIELETTVIFACWAAEEQGIHGSSDWVSRATDQSLDIYFYINFDMIGNVDYTDPLRDINIASNQASRGYAELMSEMATNYTTLYPQIINAGGGSDHVPFMQNGYNFVYGEESDFSPHWHRSTDIIDNVDIHYFAEVTQMGLATFVQVAGPPESITKPFITYCSYQIDDDNNGQSKGNNNGYLDPAETIELTINLKNVGDSLATGVTAKLLIDDPFVMLIDSSKNYGDIAAGDSVVAAEPFIFSISSESANEHSLLFTLKIEDSNNHSWNSYLLLKVKQPDITYQSYTIVEVVGDGDNVPDPGETCNLFLTLENQGLRPAQGVSATISTQDPDIIITDNEATFSDISIGLISNNNDNPLTFRIKETAGQHVVHFNVNISEGEGYYQKQITVACIIGQGPVLLIVDDGQSDNSHLYLDVLNKLGVPTTKWHVQNQGDVPLDELMKYKDVIWFTGFEAKSTLTVENRTNLETYLNSGGHLLLSGGFIGYELSGTSFFSDYLYASFISFQTLLYQLTGVAENPVTDIENISLQSNGFWPTEIDPIEPAFSILKYDPSGGTGKIVSTGTAALAVETDTFKVVYCSFSVESIESQTTRAEFIEDVLSWFGGAPIDLRAILSIANVSTDDDSLGASLGDGDGFINPEEHIELSLDLVNSGTLAAEKVGISLRTDDEFVTIIDSTATLTNIPEQSEITLTNNFVFKVNAEAPHQHSVLFDIYMIDSLGNIWSDNFSMIILYSNTISGQVFDVGTDQGIAGAQIFWNVTPFDPNVQEPFGEVSTNEAGTYSLSLPINSYELTAMATGYIVSTLVTVELPPDTVQNFALSSPEIFIAPDSILVNLDVGEIFQDSLIISNIKTGELFYSLYEIETTAAQEKPFSNTTNHYGQRVPVFLNLLGQKQEKAFVATSNSLPDPTQWKLLHQDAEESGVSHNLNKFYIQNDDRNIFFKQTVYENWNNPAADFIYAIFIDTDINPNTGMAINNIGADYAVVLGILGDLILRWIPGFQDFDAISGNPTPHHIVLPQGADSLEVGIRLSQIGNPQKLNIVYGMLDQDRLFEDMAPDNGLFYVPYSTFDADWMEESSYFGSVESAYRDTIFLSFNTDGLSLGNYLTHLVIENNQPEAELKVIPIKLIVGGTAVDGASDQLVPQKFALLQNYPNPFAINVQGNSGTIIKYQLPKADVVTIKIYNMLGQEVAKLVHSNKKAGYHEVRWDGLFSNGKISTSGIYFYRIKAGDFVNTKKMLMMH